MRLVAAGTTFDMCYRAELSLTQRTAWFVPLQSRLLVLLCAQVIHNKGSCVKGAKQYECHSQGGEPGPGVTGPTGVTPGGSTISKVLLPPGDVTLPGLPLQNQTEHIRISLGGMKDICEQFQLDVPVSEC